MSIKFGRKACSEVADSELRQKDIEFKHLRGSGDSIMVCLSKIIDVHSHPIPGTGYSQLARRRLRELGLQILALTICE
jgi:hypothetical protein